MSIHSKIYVIMEIAVYIMIVLLVVNLVVGACFYVQTRKNDKQIITFVANTQRLIASIKTSAENYSKTMFWAGCLIHLFFLRSFNRESLDFVSVVGNWIRDFSFLNNATEEKILSARNKTITELHSLLGDERFPSLSKRDVCCFEIYLTYWYEGKIPPYEMIEFCSLLAFGSRLNITELVGKMAKENDVLKKELGKL